MIRGSGLLGYTNLFFPNKYEKNDTIILKYFEWLEISFFINRFQKSIDQKKSIVLSVKNTENLKNLEHHMF